MSASGLARTMPTLFGDMPSYAGRASCPGAIFVQFGRQLSLPRISPLPATYRPHTHPQADDDDDAMLPAGWDKGESGQGTCPDFSGGSDEPVLTDHVSIYV